MAKKQSKGKVGVKEAVAGKTPTIFNDKSKTLFGAAEHQEAPSEAQPMRQRYKIAGGA